MPLEVSSGEFSVTAINWSLLGLGAREEHEKLWVSSYLVAWNA